MRIKKIFSRSRAIDLVKMGNELKREVDDKFIIGKKIYEFEMTDKFIDDYNYIASEYNKQK